MDIYMYKYACPRWWGVSRGLRNMNADSELDEKEVIKIAHEDANRYTGSKTCDVSLLQKFHVSITPIKNYAALASIPFSVPKNNTINDEEQNETSKSDTSDTILKAADYN